MAEAASASYRQGVIAYGNGDLAGAKVAFQQAISADSKAHQAHYSFAVVLERLGDAGALEEYRQAYTIKPDYEQAIAGYALFLARKGNLTEAESFLNGKRGQLPNSAAVIATLAEVSPCSATPRRPSSSLKRR